MQITMKNINGIYMESTLSPEEQTRIMRKFHDDMARRFDRDKKTKPAAKPEMTETDKMNLFKKSLIVILGTCAVILLGMAIYNFL